MTRALLLLAVAAALAGCGEQPQIANRTTQDSALYLGTGKPFQATGWKAGDRNSWEQQLKTRTQQGQNEYNKVN